MFFMRPILTALGIAEGTMLASEAPPSRVQLHQAIKRSLVFLEKSAADWKDGNNGVGVD